MTSPWSSMLEELRAAIAEAVPVASDVVFEIPPDPAMGDVAVPCFLLSKILKQAPGEIAVRIAETLSAHPLVVKAEGVGGYCNVTLEAGEVARRVLADSHAISNFKSQISNDSTTPSSSPSGRGGETEEEIVLEFISPNSNKPLHLGHLRNAFFGEAVGRLLEAMGHRVHRVMLLNDRGIAMAKAMLAYARWGEGATPESAGKKGDHFVGGWYVQFERKNKDENKDDDNDTRRTPLEEEAQELVRKWEAGDQETRALWQRMCGWVIAGHRETLDAIGIAFEKTYRESDIYERGRSIVADALVRGVFTKDERGNTIAPLKDRFGLDDKVVERADGTTVYATQDLALVEAKAKDYPDARSIVVTAAEQDYYFQQLNAIIRSLSRGESDEGSHTGDVIFRYGEILRLRARTRSAQDELRETQPIEHLSYEMVHLPEGRMKSREGTVVDADDLLAKLEEMATAEIAARADAVPGEPATGTDEPPIVPVFSSSVRGGGDQEGVQRAQDIALAAIRFYLLHANPRTVLTFNPKESLSFTGKTGPYLQYMHARMCAIQRRNESDVGATRRGRPSGGRGQSPAPTQATLLIHPAEKALLLRIARFPDVIAEAAAQRDPSHLAQFAYDFAQAFADFYRDCPVIRAEGDLHIARLALLDASKRVLGEALRLLGIAALEEM